LSKDSSSATPSYRLPPRQNIMLLKIRQNEPSRYPPTIFDVFLVICCAILLVFSSLIISLWVSNKFIVPSTIDIIWLALLFVALPIWGITDTIITRVKYHKAYESDVAKYKDIFIKGNIDSIFSICLQILEDEMRAKAIVLDVPKLFRGELRNWLATSIFAVRVSQLKNGRVKIQVSSDSIWLTTRFDFGINQRNINRFVQLLRIRLEDRQFPKEASINDNTGISPNKNLAGDIISSFPNESSDHKINIKIGKVIYLGDKDNIAEIQIDMTIISKVLHTNISRPQLYIAQRPYDTNDCSPQIKLDQNLYSIRATYRVPYERLSRAIWPLSDGSFAYRGHIQILSGGEEIKSDDLFIPKHH